MKIIKTLIITSLILLTQACTSQQGQMSSGASNKHLSGDAKKLMKIISGDQSIRADWIKRKNDPNFVKRAFKAANNLTLSNPGVYEPGAEGLLIEMLSGKTPIEGSWTVQNHYIENPVWENNAIIDKERNSVGLTKFRLVEAGGVVQYDLSGNGMIVQGQEQSIMRMRRGQSPIGPDGQPMSLCRMLKSPKASFFEVSEMEKKRFLELSNNQDKDDICMKHPEAYEPYWKSRALK